MARKRGKGRRGNGRWSAGITGAALGVAAGAALGAFVLAPGGIDLGGVGGGGDAARERDEAIAQRDDAETRADAANEVVTDLAAQVVDGALEEIPVLLVVAPDANPESADAMAELLGDAGAHDAGRIVLTEKFVSAQSADELKDVVTGALPAGATLDPERRDPGFQAGQAMAPALLLDDGDGERAPAPERGLLLGSLRDAGFIDYEDGTIRPAAAVVLVAGAGSGEGEDPGFGTRVLGDFAEALDADRTVVVGGEPESARDNGVVAHLRDAEVPVGTTAAIGDPSGRVSVVRAIVEGEGE